MLKNTIQSLQASPNIMGRLKTVACLSLAFVVVAGCGSTPERTSYNGRMDDPYTTTEADAGSSKASMPALYEFGDQAAQSLAQRISDLPQVKERFNAANNTQTRMVLYLGSIDNQTRTPSSDFEMIQRRLRSQLMSSDLIKSKFMFVEDKARIDRDINRVQATGGASAQYNTDDMFLLQGDFMESNRGSVRRYFFNFKLTHPKTGEIVFDEAFDLGQKIAH